MNVKRGKWITGRSRIQDPGTLGQHSTGGPSRVSDVTHLDPGKNREAKTSEFTQRTHESGLRVTGNGLLLDMIKRDKWCGHAERLFGPEVFDSLDLQERQGSSKGCLRFENVYTP